MLGADAIDAINGLGDLPIGGAAVVAIDGPEHMSGAAALLVCQARVRLGRAVEQGRKQLLCRLDAIKAGWIERNERCQWCSVLCTRQPQEME